MAISYHLQEAPCGVESEGGQELHLRCERKAPPCSTSEVLPDRPKQLSDGLPGQPVALYDCRVSVDLEGVKVVPDSAIDRNKATPGTPRPLSLSLPLPLAHGALAHIK